MNYGSKGFAAVFCFLISLTPGIAESQSVAPICRLNRYQPEIVSWIPRFPSYFAKISPDAEVAYYISSGNNMLYLEEKDNSLRNKRIPGSIDPVPCPDGKILTIPGLDLFEVSALKRDGRSAQPILEDWEHSGVYQSCGVLSEVGNKTTYRMITDTRGQVSYRDYEVEFSDQEGVAAKATPLGETKLRCPALNMKTIIISKTGKYVSGYFPSEGTTKIIDIEGSTNECKVALDLGFATGKLEFNYDDTRVTFHVDYFNSQVGSYFSGVSGVRTKDVFTLDLISTANGLAAKNLRRITTSTEMASGSYYPSFAKDGRLMLINDDKNFYSFQVFDPEKIPAFDFLIPPIDGWVRGRVPQSFPANWKERLHAAAVIGSLWGSRCSPDEEELSAVDASSFVLNMPITTCKSLIREGWNPQRAMQMSTHRRFTRDTRFDPNMIRNMTLAQLEQSCVEIPKVQFGHTSYYGEKLLDNLNGPRAVHHYCVGCHTSGGLLSLPDGSTTPNSLDFDKLEPWQISEALVRIELPQGEPGSMPPSGFEPPTGSTDHKKLVREYLQCLLDEATSTDPSRTFRCD